MLLEVRGRTVLDRVVARLRAAQRPELLVVCTTTEPGDDALEAAARDLGAEVYRGSTQDILVRWLGAADKFGVDFFAACDGDDVLCDPEFVDRVIECHERTGADYVTCVGLPFGAAPTGIARSALRRVCSLKRETDTAGQGRFFADDRIITRAEVRAPSALAHAEARMTLDYADDLEFFEALLAELEPFGDQVTMAQIVETLRGRPDLVEINAGLQERYWQRFNDLYPPVELSSS